MSPRTMTLLIVHQHPKILLAMKKRGFGVGRWNGYGGKVKGDETIEQAMERELLEEGKIAVKGFEKRGILHFRFPHNQDFDCNVHIFKATEFHGEPKETEEMRPGWFHVDEIPFKEMWPDDE